MFPLLVIHAGLTPKIVPVIDNNNYIVLNYFKAIYMCII